MSESWRIDYESLAAAHLRGTTRDAVAFARAVAAQWIDRYRAATSWSPEILELALGSVVYLFDEAPGQRAHGTDASDARVVGVWGRATTVSRPREQSRQRGFLPDSSRWSRAGFDRGHFVAHSLGGGMDVNFFPQAVDLNRGRSPAGRRWRELERRAGASADALVLVRPVYDSDTWVPRWLDFGVVVGGDLDVETFDNTPEPHIANGGGAVVPVRTPRRPARPSGRQ